MGNPREGRKLQRGQRNSAHSLTVPITGIPNSRVETTTNRWAELCRGPRPPGCFVQTPDNWMDHSQLCTGCKFDVMSLQVDTRTCRTFAWHTPSPVPPGPRGSIMLGCRFAGPQSAGTVPPDHPFADFPVFFMDRMFPLDIVG